MPSSQPLKYEWGRSVLKTLLDVCMLILCVRTDRCEKIDQSKSKWVNCELGSR